MQIEDRRKEIEQLYASWQVIRQDFVVPVNSDNENAEEIYRRDLVNIAENADIGVPLKFISHRKYIGPLISFAKNSIAILGAPFVKVLLHRQRIINAHVLNLASQIAAIDARLRKIEEGQSKH